MKETNDVTRPSRPFPPFLILLATFAAGVFLDRLGWLPGRSDQQPPATRKTFAPFWEVWNKVNDYYVDRGKIDDQTMTQGAIVGMLRTLGDEGHTSYLSKEDRERATEELGGQMQGIGARVSMRQRKPTVIQTMPGSPARAAGVRPGDVLVTVDGNGLENLSLNQVVNRVRGKAGSEVTLGLRRPIRPKANQITYDPGPLEIRVTRAKVDVPEVAWQVLPGGPKVAHLALQRFGKDSGERMKAELENLLAEGVRGVILDLRGNVGGYKDQCIAISSQFLPEGTVLFIQEDAKGNQEKITATGGGKAINMPLCVLIDGGTASSAEILAGALQDHDRAPLIGTQTFGTGTVLREYPLSDGAAVRLAVYKWLTPNGREIWHKGITPNKDLDLPLPADGQVTFPDPEIPLTEADLHKSTDNQLLKALDLLKQKLTPAVPPAKESE